MSVTETIVVDADKQSSKRKRDEELAEIEVDVDAAEPPSKKALRKAKKAKTTPGQDDTEDFISLGKNTETTKSDKNSKSGPKNASKGDSTKGEDQHDVATNRKRSGFGIWIGNLSFATTKEELITFLTSDRENPIAEGQITRVHMSNGPKKLGKPQNKGFAYVDFIDADTLANGLELSEKLLAGRRVLIKDAKSFEGRPASKEDIASGKTPSRRIFVGNLSFDTTTETLEEHFGVCGNILKTQVAAFEDSGKCKGYAWVEFEKLEDAKAAMRGWVEQDASGGVRVDKKRIWLSKIDGRKLRMEFAEDATTRYNKRFGKDAKKVVQNAETETPEQQEPITEVSDKDQQPARQFKQRQDSARKRQPQRYEQETVQRLTGAITESQGKKVVFD
ncbi:Nucleolar protein 13 [Lithohypha guttulata]|uniref:Nucleolar protein 13 n=1 Tax=Lithohypha guttulata TaxID=1690604 RepID=A0AAN7SUD0_9EURO|nr:Nucleolar protein 13 [Lithohypha guttulata]